MASVSLGSRRRFRLRRDKLLWRGKSAQQAFRKPNCCNYFAKFGVPEMVVLLHGLLRCVM